MIAHHAFDSGSYAIVGGIELTGLGLLRALGRAKVPTIALDTNMDRPTAATRFGTLVLGKPLAGPVFIDEPLALRRRFANDPVLYLTQEASVATISAAREKLAGAYP